MKKPVFKKILQICIVVDDIYAYIKRFNDDYGIGPWTILDFNNQTVKEMVVKGKPEDYSMKLALCDALNVQLELIEPTSDNSIYAEFLRKNGPGLHHIACETQGYRQIMDDLASRGITEIYQGGVDSGGMRFSYVDLTKELGFILELYDPPKDFVPPPPVDVYPKKLEKKVVTV